MLLASTAWLGVVCAAVPAVGQGGAVDFASPYLPVDHWSVAAVHRLDALGLVRQGRVHGRAALTVREVGVALAEASRRIRSTGKAGSSAGATEAAARAGVAGLVESYVLRFATEFPATAAAVARAGGGRGPSIELVGWVDGGVEHGSGLLGPGHGYHNDSTWTGPVRLEERTATGGRGSILVTFSPALALGLRPAWRTDGARLEAGTAHIAWRGAGAWIGRQVLGYGAARGGGIVLAGNAALDGGGLRSVDPITLPGVLEAVGPIHVEGVLARLERNGDILRPWLFSSRASIHPHARLDVAVTRAAMFGGEGNESVSLRNLLFVMVGKHGSGGSQFDNQIVAVELGYRPPLAALPTRLYLEWGFEDSAGAWWSVPGRVVGATVAAVPGLPELAVGLERTAFAPRCCGNPIWYRHWRFHGGWTDGSRPLGHPLGGHGTEWRIYGTADLSGARLRLDAEAFTRERRAENLYWPDRAGRSYGARVEARWSLGARFELLFAGGLESEASEGSAGAEVSLRASGRVRF